MDQSKYPKTGSTIKSALRGPRREVFQNYSYLDKGGILRDGDRTKTNPFEYGGGKSNLEEKRRVQGGVPRRSGLPAQNVGESG